MFTTRTCVGATSRTISNYGSHIEKIWSLKGESQ